jgi:ABC-type sugar transport system permease subunit
LQGSLVLINVVLNLIGGFQVFDLVFVLSRGPMITTHINDVLSTYLVYNSFGSSSLGGGRSQLGYAAAIAVVMMTMMIIFATLRNRLRQSLEY